MVHFLTGIRFKAPAQKNIRFPFGNDLRNGQGAPGPDPLISGLLCRRAAVQVVADPDGCDGTVFPNGIKNDDGFVSRIFQQISGNVFRFESILLPGPADKSHSLPCGLLFRNPRAAAVRDDQRFRRHAAAVGVEEHDIAVRNHAELGVQHQVFFRFNKAARHIGGSAAVRIGVPADEMIA